MTGVGVWMLRMCRIRVDVSTDTTARFWALDDTIVVSRE